MGILDEDVARVRESTDLVALASEHLALKRVGQRFVGLCPFHSEKSPSFSINPSMGLFHCFGCQKSGDAITFVREVDHLDFVGAVERLAAKANITLRYDDASHTRDRQRKIRLAEAVGAAIDFYHRRLIEADDGGNARRYIRSRGFDGDAVRQFVLGWSPDKFDALSKHLQQAKFARDDIVGAGLAFVNRTNSLQDQFRGRLMFPIYDGRGDPVGFGGRALEGGQGPKYKNSPETPIYQKSRLLYGLNWAKAEIVARGEVVICEGYTDVMAFALSGVPQAVATCGTALADEHFQILKNLARKVTLAYDADAAGQAAAERCYQWEQKYEVQFQVADLPAGRDPADVWRDDPERLAKAVNAATAFLQFRIDRVLAAADLSSPEGRARAAEDLVPVLREHPNELVREGYIQRVAGTLGVEHAWFKDAIARNTRPRVRVEPRRERAAQSVDPRELDLLRWAIHRPELVADWLDDAYFADPLAREVFIALDSADTVPGAIESSSGEVRAILERISVEEPEVGEETTLRARLMANAVEPAAQRRLDELLRSGDERSAPMKVLLDELVRGRTQGEWKGAEQAAGQLVTWITGVAEE
ncbi:MAG: DNA primase [Acidimicrobiia bacterium]